MVLAFTQEQKEIINAHGMSVVEFKYKLQRTTQIFGKAFENAMEVLTDFAERIANAFSSAIKLISETADTIKLAINQVRDHYGLNTCHRYKLCKILSKCTFEQISVYAAWRMTRGTFLARSNC